MIEEDSRMSKNRRQAYIMQLVSAQEIATQEDLVAALQAEGFDVAQATVSRDLRSLGLVKRADKEGRVYYHLAETLDGMDDDRWSKVYREAVLNVAVAGTLVVVQTLPGMAPGAAAFIDRAEEDGLVGSIAGDDTIFLATVSVAAAERLASKLEGFR